MNLRQAGTLTAILLLASCGPSSCGGDKHTERAEIFHSAAECEVALDSAGKRRFTDEQCEKALDEAKEDLAKTAPRYEALGSCESIYGQGNCVPRRDGDHDTFMPMFAGFMLGHMMGEPPRAVYYDRFATPYIGSTPLSPYRDRAGVGWVAPSASPYRGGFGGSASSITAPTAPEASRAAVTAPSVSRGGFGATAASTAASAGE